MAVVPAVRPKVASALVPPAAITRLCDVPVLSTSLPALMVEAVAVPVIPSTALRTSPTVSVLPVPTPIVTLPLASVLTLVCAVLKVMDLPSTVTLEPFVGVVASGSEQVVGASASDRRSRHVGLRGIADRALEHLVGDRLGARNQALQRGDAGV